MLNEDRKGGRLLFCRVGVGKETIYREVDRCFLPYTRWRVAAGLHLALLRQILTLAEADIEPFNHDKIQNLLNLY